MSEQRRVDAWRHEAEAARAQAAGFQDPEAQRSMLEVATAYDLLARLEEAARTDATGDQVGPAPSR
jgi:hypothetical protein